MMKRMPKYILGQDEVCIAKPNQNKSKKFCLTRKAFHVTVFKGDSVSII